jgi:hypothetical protein
VPILAKFLRKFWLHLGKLADHQPLWAEDISKSLVKSLLRVSCLSKWTDRFCCEGIALFNAGTHELMWNFNWTSLFSLNASDFSKVMYRLSLSGLSVPVKLRPLTSTRDTFGFEKTHRF